MSGVTITSNPCAALGDAALLVGVEREENGDLRLYVGARYRGVYALVEAGETADAIVDAWNGTAQHLWLHPAPKALFSEGS
jgi:hypothetical protein